MESRITDTFLAVIVCPSETRSSINPRHLQQLHKKKTNPTDNPSLPTTKVFRGESERQRQLTSHEARRKPQGVEA